MAKIKLSVGDKAPDFKMHDQNGKLITLKDFKGQKVLLYFYPKAMTPGCTVQACSIRDTAKEFKKLDVVVIGVSPDSPERLKKFEDRDKLNFILASDPENEVAKSYGSYGKKKFMGREFMGVLRQTFLIDEKGKIIHIMEKVNTKTHHEEYLEIIKNLE